MGPRWEVFFTFGPLLQKMWPYDLDASSILFQVSMSAAKKMDRFRCRNVNGSESEDLGADDFVMFSSFPPWMVLGFLPSAEKRLPRLPHYVNILSSA